MINQYVCLFEIQITLYLFFISKTKNFIVLADGVFLVFMYKKFMMILTLMTETKLGLRFKFQKEKWTDYPVIMINYYELNFS